MRFKVGSIHSISSQLQAQAMAKSGKITPGNAAKMLGKLGGVEGATKAIRKQTDGLRKRHDR